LQVWKLASNRTKRKTLRPAGGRQTLRLEYIKRRDAYRNAFADYNAEKVAEMTAQDVERLMQNSGIIRNRRKIEATISNARLPQWNEEK